MGITTVALGLAAVLPAGAVKAGALKTGSARPRKIVLIAGEMRGHDKQTHEYEKSVILLKHLLDTSPNLKGARTEIYFKGWPEDERALDDADTIVLVTDGTDRNETDHPLYVGDHMKTVEKQMRRGCSFVQFHWSTFAPSRFHDQITEWVGGYFDYETGDTPNHWYSAIQTYTGPVSPGAPTHPIWRGVKPFTLQEEFYYRILFRPDDPRVTPILLTRPPGAAQDYPVAWAVQRQDGGRAFGFTGGHFYKNWWLEDYRKLILNAIAWTAGIEVPKDGIESRLDPPMKALILTGHHHPGHDWRQLTAALIHALEQDPRMQVDVTENIEDMATAKIDGYDALVMNYNNWDRPGLSALAKEHFVRYLRSGGGLAIIHFANGAFNYTLPNRESDWPEYRTRIVRRAWMHDAPSSHDPYGDFKVAITGARSPITAGLQGFSTRDELYFHQIGDQPIAALATAHSKVTGNDEPMAWAYTYGKGRIFQTVLGHDAQGIQSAAALIRRGAVWAARRDQISFDPPTALIDNAVFRNGSQWTVEQSLRAAAMNTASVSDAVDHLAGGRSGKALDGPVVAEAQATLGPLPVVDRRTSEPWLNVGNDKGGMRYSTLKQIDRSNVKNLQVAWEYRSGDVTSGSTIECTPIVVDGVMYVTTPSLKIVALDAATGHEIWTYNPHSGGVNRGVAYWSDGRSHGKRRILMGTPDGRLLSLDAATGLLDPAFGNNGVVDLRAGTERDISGMTYGVTSAPAVFENLIYLGFLVSEGQPGAPGDVRAFDTHTGKEVWRFVTAPRPGEVGNETWEGDGWKDRTGVNAWGGYTLDAKRGILFCATGSASSDFYGADRLGANLFANCTLALDARTGKRLWHFQEVHHDLWDHDNPCPPVTVTVVRNGKRIDAVAQVTKSGYCYLFDRVTGDPLFEVKEHPAPPSDIPGERAYPTQPAPVKPPPFSPQLFTDDDITNISPEAHAYVTEMLRHLRYGKAHLPPSVEGTVIIPGFHGGANWSGACFDPTTGLLYVNSNNVPYISVLKPNSAGGYDFGGYTYFNDQNGYPGNKPPWGSLTAIDLSRGDFAWQVALGEFPALTAQGVPQTGTENFGGAIVTAGGLVFIGGTRDEAFHAFDKATGKLLWQVALPAGGYATPCTYSINGRQYVVIAAGGGGKLRTRSGDTFVAFALPDKPGSASGTTSH